MEDKFIVEIEVQLITWVAYEVCDSVLEAVELANNLRMLIRNRVRVIFVVNKA